MEGAFAELSPEAIDVPTPDLQVPYSPLLDDWCIVDYRGTRNRDQLVYFQTREFRRFFFTSIRCFFTTCRVRLNFSFRCWRNHLKRLDLLYFFYYFLFLFNLLALKLLDGLALSLYEDFRLFY